MTATMGRYRYWGDQRPDTSRPLLTFTRPSEAVAATARTGETADGVTATTGTLRIYGPIDSYGGWWGVSSKEVAQALDLLEGATRLVVRVNSPGGESAEGRAIMNLLRAHSAEIVTVVDGGAYSAASYIALAGNDRVMSPGATMMIHDTSTIIYGNADAFRKTADVLDTLSDSGAELYAAIAGGTVEEWRDRQRAESWYTAATAVAAGLMQRVDVVSDTGLAETAGDDGPETVEASDVEERARAAYDTSLFLRAPKELHPKPPTASADGNTHTEGGSAVAFSDAQLTTMRQKLGIAEDADEATIVAALDEALNERAESTAPAPSTPVIPEGMALVDSAALTKLQQGAEAGLTAAATLGQQERTKAFNDALEAGKLTAATAKSLKEKVDADPETWATTKALLDALTPGVVPTVEVGHGSEPEASDSLYTDVWGDDTEKKGA